MASSSFPRNTYVELSSSSLAAVLRPQRPQVGQNRGRWLFRGYLVDDAMTHISGRWRETVSPAESIGYEGCFVMERRL